MPEVPQMQEYVPMPYQEYTPALPKGNFIIVPLARRLSHTNFYAFEIHQIKHKIHNKTLNMPVNI